MFFFAAWKQYEWTNNPILIFYGIQRLDNGRRFTIAGSSFIRKTEAESEMME